MPHDPTTTAALPRLDRSLVEDALRDRTGLIVPETAELDLPERAVQFGTGAFLRGFVEYFLDEARRAGTFDGRVLAIGSTGSGRAGLLNEQDGLYTLVSRGLVDGQPHREVRVVGSLSRAVPASEAWDAALECARSPALELVFSNTTEVGITLDPDDRPDLDPPRSFPGKLTAFLHERARAFDYAPERAPVVIPCELLEDNGDALRSIVLELAGGWALEPDFAAWVEESVVFCNTLVDRIVPGAPPDDEGARLAAELGYRDALLTTCEPYRLFAIEGDAALRRRLGFAAADAGVVVTPDIRPYRERKILILNGGHTSMVPLALLAGLETVADAVEDPAVGPFVRRAMLDEIAPLLGHGVSGQAGQEAPGLEDAHQYALQVLDRFANPFIDHALIDITLQCTTKMRVRVVPSILRYAEAHGEAPPCLTLGFAAWLLWMRGDVQAERRAAGLRVPPDDAGAAVTGRWSAVDPAEPGALARFVTGICADTGLWATDLTRVPGFAGAVTAHIDIAIRDGIRSALAALLAEPATGGPRDR